MTPHGLCNSLINSHSFNKRLQPWYIFQESKRLPFAVTYAESYHCACIPHVPRTLSVKTCRLTPCRRLTGASEPRELSPFDPGAAEINTAPVQPPPPADRRAGCWGGGRQRGGAFCGTCSPLQLSGRTSGAGYPPEVASGPMGADFGTARERGALRAGLAAAAPDQL